MLCNQNEKYLLKFISSLSDESKQNDGLVEIIHKLGIKPKFNNYNPVYQIIDEMNWELCSVNNLTGNYNE